MGVTVIDIGGGTTTLSIFADGQFVYTDAVPVGGNHISFDIARALNTPLAEAERIKALYGTLVGAQSDEHELISYSLAGDEAGSTYQTTKAQLAQIIRPRVNSMLALVGERYRAVVVLRLTPAIASSSRAADRNWWAWPSTPASSPDARRGSRARWRCWHCPPGFASPAFATVIGLIAARGAARGNEGVVRSRSGM